jgi:thiaminase
MTLTQTLLSHPSTSSSYKRATQHPFLVSAGKLELSAASLQAWLTQDRLYALCGYAPFLGLLISKCPAPAAGPDEASSKQHRKRLTVLAGAMANIDREVGFFEDVARENGLQLDASRDDSGLGLLNSTTRVSAR